MELSGTQKINTLRLFLDGVPTEWYATYRKLILTGNWQDWEKSFLKISFSEKISEHFRQKEVELEIFHKTRVKISGVGPKISGNIILPSQNNTTQLNFKFRVGAKIALLPGFSLGWGNITASLYRVFNETKNTNNIEYSEIHPSGASSLCY